MNKSLCAVSLGIALFCCGPAIGTSAETPPKAVGVPELLKRAHAAREAGDHAAWRQALRQLHAQRPNNSDYMYQLVLAHALNGDRSAAYELMLKMQQQGLSYDFNATEDSRNIRGTQAYDYVNDLMVRAGQPAGDAQLMVELPADIALPTAVAWDPSRNALLIGLAIDGSVHALTPEGELTGLLRADDENGMWGVFGLHVDAGRNRLWITSAASQLTIGFDPAQAGRSALFEFALDTLTLVRQYPVPVDGRPHRLGSMAQAGDGTLYLADTLIPMLYRLDPGSERLQPFVAAGDLVSLRGMALSADDSKLYVADYEMGVMVLDLVARQVSMLQVPANFNPGGIEMLREWDGHLVVIQNGLSPQRIMRLKLRADGLGVEAVAPLAVAQPFFDYPNFGVVVGEELYFLANSHWVARPGREPQPVRVARTNVSAARDLVAPDMQKFLDEWKQEEERAAQTPPGG